MRQDLFYIPHEIYGVPVFGAGWLLLLWAVVSLLVLVWLWRRQGWSTETRSFLPVMIVVAVVIWGVLPRLEARIFSRPGGSAQQSEAGDLERPQAEPKPIGLPIRGYGVMLLLGVVSGVALAAHEARRGGLDPEAVYSFAFYVFIGGIAGARLFYVIEYWEDFQRPTLTATMAAIANVTQGGLVVYGSLIGGAGAGLWYLRKHRLPILAMADLVTPSLMLGLALGRIGCLMNGCCHGGICEDSTLGIRFPQGSPPYIQQSQLGQLHGFRIAPASDGQTVIVNSVEPDGPAASSTFLSGAEIRSINGVAIDSFDTARAVLEKTPGELFVETNLGTAQIRLADIPNRSRPVHPTQIYSSINAGLLCLVLWAFYPLRRRDGEVFALLLSLYPVTRFLLELIRTDEPAQWGTSLSISQIVSVILLAAAALLWVYLLRRPRGTALPVATA